MNKCNVQAKAVATEDYTTAKRIKMVEGELKSLGTQLAQLVRLSILFLYCLDADDISKKHTFLFIYLFIYSLFFFFFHFIY